MRVDVNGEPRELPDGSTITDLLQELKLDRRYLAVERNREVVPRERHNETRLVGGDQLEVVTLVGGG
ncbi:MAG: sulfur carrier protein ThiS [Planctomycetota bacterium]